MMNSEPVLITAVAPVASDDSTQILASNTFHAVVLFGEALVRTVTSREPFPVKSSFPRKVKIRPDVRARDFLLIS